MIRQKGKKRTFCVMNLFAIVVGIVFFSGHTTAFAEETALSFRIEKEVFHKAEEANLFIEMKNVVPEEQTVVVEYPATFTPEIEEIEKANSEQVTKVTNKPKEHQLIFDLKKEQTTCELMVQGRFSEIGNQRFLVTYNHKQIETVLSVENEETKTSEKEATSSSSTQQESSSVSPESKEKTKTSETGSVESSDSKEKRTSSQKKQSSNEVKERVLEGDGDDFPTFDWNLLNTDGLDLSTFTSVDTSTPVKLSGGLFDLQQREYYLFLGHLNNTRYYYDTGEFKSISGENSIDHGLSVTAKMNNRGKTRRETPIASPALIGVKKRSGTEKYVEVLDHSWGTQTATQFDVGEMDSRKGAINDSTHIFNSTYMVSEYVKKNELVAYGFIGRSRPDQQTSKAKIDYQPVRMHAYVTDYKSGRVRYDFSYYNPNDTSKFYAMNYGLHIDIGGAHKNSKLFSNNEDGLYFDEKKVPADGIGEKLYFHMKGYYGTNGPTAYKVGTHYNDPDALWTNLKKFEALYNPIKGAEDPYETWDDYKPEGFQFPLDHPVFAYRWDPVEVPSYGVGKGSFDISLEEIAEKMPKAEQSYINQTSTDGKNRLNDALDFTLTAKNDKDATADWENISIKDVIPKGLTIDPSTIQLIDSNGQEASLPSSVYHPDTRTIEVGKYTLSPGSKIQLKFKAKITGEAGKTIVNTMEAGNGIKEETREADATIPVEEQEQEEHSLDFISAPSRLDFGQNLTIDSVDQTYPLRQKDESLTVRDSRGKGNHWRMMATVTKELTSPTKHQLVGSLHYKKAGKDIPLVLGESSLIFEKETIDDAEVVISDEWSGIEKGPVLEVTAGQPHAESYSGTIQWALQDVPGNQE